MGDRNVEYLALFEKLEKLYVEDTYLTDEGLQHLHKLKSLRELDCSWNKHITDGGVKFLAKLTQLKSLDVSRTAISPQGLEELRRALPKTKVD
jgi:Leucine-rich repeat (LRR) protein